MCAQAAQPSASTAQPKQKAKTEKQISSASHINQLEKSTGRNHDRKARQKASTGTAGHALLNGKAAESQLKSKTKAARQNGRSKQDHKPQHQQDRQQNNPAAKQLPVGGILTSSLAFKSVLSNCMVVRASSTLSTIPVVTCLADVL